MSDTPQTNTVLTQYWNYPKTFANVKLAISLVF